MAYQPSYPAPPSYPAAGAYQTPSFYPTLPPAGYPYPQQPQAGSYTNRIDPWKPGQHCEPVRNLPATAPVDDTLLKTPVYKPESMEGLQEVPGYGAVGFQTLGHMPPPLPANYVPPQGGPMHEFNRGANVTAEEARNALLEEASANCCWGTSAAKDMAIKDVSHTNALHYTLETFSESRSSTRKEAPFHGGQVDGLERGPPGPWSVPCQPPGLFHQQTKEVTVPHTEQIRTCSCCKGKGYNCCFRCHGFTKLKCASCRGSGQQTFEREGQTVRECCSGCAGSGSMQCYTCKGFGNTICAHCDGYRLVKNFIQLTVKFTTHSTDYVFEETALPDEMVKSVGGIELFNQTLPEVAPISTYPARVINDNSGRLVESHRTSFPTERRLQQRQSLRAIPVTQVSCNWKDKYVKYWVYGTEKKVYAPNYPQQCSCTIL